MELPVQTQRNLVAARTRVEIDRAVELLIRRRATRQEYERDVLAHLPDLKRMAEASYRFGQGTLLELLDASRARTDIRLAYLDMLLAEAEAELDTLRAAGTLLAAAEQPAPPGAPRLLAPAPPNGSEAPVLAPDAKGSARVPAAPP